MTKKIRNEIVNNCIKLLNDEIPYNINTDEYDFVLEKLVSELSNKKINVIKKPKHCICNGGEFGKYDNKVVVQMPDYWETNRESRLFSVDSCMVPELKRLWDLGIRTIECCCGHGRVNGYIAVEENSIKKMLSEGYANNIKKGREDLFLYPKETSNY